MKDFLEYLVKNIVDLPEGVKVQENSDGGSNVTLTLQVDPTDMGKVIGKQGRIIRSLRELVYVLAVKENRKVNIILQEA